MEKIVVLDRATIAPNINVRAPVFAHEWLDYDSTAPDQVASRAEDASILVVNKVRVNRENLAGASRLKLITVAATGLDNIDLRYCREHGITVSNIRNYAVHTVPEHAFSLILALSRNLIGYREDVPDSSASSTSRFSICTKSAWESTAKVRSVSRWRRSDGLLAWRSFLRLTRVSTGSARFTHRSTKWFAPRMCTPCIAPWCPALAV